MMKLVQIFFPVYDNDGRRFSAQMFSTERKKLVEHFGGMTAHTRAPAHGLWKDGPPTKREDIVIFEVMMRKVDRKWWNNYRHALQKRFKQKELLIRAQDVKVL
jgi:hypothetical protein